MCLAAAALFQPLPFGPGGGGTLLGIDYVQLHAHRIAYARNSLAAGRGVPGWYSRELMGSPFRANAHSFPFIPTRLAILPLDPDAAYGPAVALSAALAALFTFLFARRLGLSLVGAAAAGWTFSASGFFASRVLAGHLPLLEAFGALPLMLWRVEVYVQDRRSGRGARPSLAALAAAACCVVLAGHPQLPFYAGVTAMLYLLCRAWGDWRGAARAASAAGLGAAAAAFSLWPMARLAARSTRTLAGLDLPPNDVAFPYGRLSAFLFPWKDGWPHASLGTSAGREFGGYPNVAFFWDTVCYIGWLPLIAVIATALVPILRRRKPRTAWVFLAFAGTIALLTALPFIADTLDRAVPGVLLRSPARQLYVTTFALAMALGAGVDLLHGIARRLPLRAAAPVVVSVVFLIHAVDLGMHARAFVRGVHPPARDEASAALERDLVETVGEGRIAVDPEVLASYNRAIDDVGFFDAVLLARPYATLLDLAGLPASTNTETLAGSQLPVRALAATGTRLVVTTRDRPDLHLLSGPSNALKVYELPKAAARRAAFFPAAAVRFTDEVRTHALLRDAGYDPASGLLLPARSGIASGGVTSSVTLPQQTSGSVTYERPSPDEIVLRATVPHGGGVVRVLETWDPGWRAEVDGAGAEIVPADGAFMGVALGEGEHAIRLRYATPGARVGAIVSCVAVLLLVLLVVRTKAPPPAAPRADAA